ncbi:amino acid adenylation domain-containing protein [Plantactinospora sp. ZYX-F-223]|uniref:non-ribosomal peptide synthetase n=1 Tax=Plantactinospora sp. ZYX-F-223 TaxID=3144103 RepID=UPI0031FCC520
MTQAVHLVPPEPPGARAPTVTAGADGPHREVVAGSPAGVPLTLAQQGVWFTERAGGASTAYLLAVALTVPEPVEPAVLDQAWTVVTARHPLLATSVREADGEPLLAPTDPMPVTYRAVGPAALGPAVAAELTAGFDLTAGPLARCVALRVDDGRTVVLVVAHHLVLDGGGKDVLAADLAGAVAGRALGAGSLDPLQPGPRGADAPPPALRSGGPQREVENGSLARLSAAVRAQTDRIAEALPAARDFWSARPAPAGEVVLPGLTGTPTAAEPATHLDLDWGAELDAALTAGAAALGATRFEVLLAAVHAVLARYGNGIASVAIDLSTRSPETAHELGMWVNELPVTVGVDLETSFAELVRAVRAEARAVYRHREVPLGRALPGLPPRPAMAPVSVSYRRPAEGSSNVDLLLAPATVRSALHLHLVDAPAGLAGRMHVPARLLPVADAERIAGHLRTLLAAALHEPDRPVGDLDLLVPAELALLDRLNATARPRPVGTVLDLVRAAAQADPDAVAVCGDDGTLTYRELVAAAHRIGHRLRRHGVASGDLVGLCARRGVELVAGVLGILAAGAAYLPLDPSYPVNRLEFLATDAGAKLVLGHVEATAALGGLPIELLPLDGLAEFAGELGTAPTATDPDGLAYVIYTSGSTGRPKGVEIGHRALLNLVSAMTELLGADPADRWLQQTTVSFDISALELFAPLCTGGRVVVAADATVREGTALGRLIRDAGITHVQATPSSWHLLLDAGWAGAPVTALSGGEALPLPVARRLRPLVDRLVNVYGPTETTIWSTAAEIPADPSRVTIGGPLANTTLHVLDARLRPVPVGVPGELCIGGAGLARAYRGRPELTAERFVPDGTGRRCYRTGDRVRLGPDGAVEFLGRADNQIKLRGYRIELGEIEQALLGAPAVAQAAVAVRDGELVAYLVGAGDLAPIRAHLAGTLPRYMIPRDFVRLDRLPRTPAGKLDRAALPAPARTELPSPAAGSETAGVPDTGALTRTVAGIWREVLRIDEVGPGDSLFDLGGHSLTIMQITARIRRALGVEVPFDVFFDTPTIDGVVGCIEELRQEEQELRPEESA